MRKISDELREWAKLLKRSVYTKLTAEEISAFADHIDAEMVELPRDANGKPIHVGETVYELNGNKVEAVSFHLYDEGDPTWMVSVGYGADVPPCDLTHERPDSLERIADDLDDCDNPHSLDENALHHFADRIRKLAKEGEHE